MATIALKERTHDLLNHLKVETRAETYDEVIQKLIITIKKPRRSMFGVLKGVTEEFKREELDRFAGAQQ